MTADPLLTAPAIFWFWNADPTPASIEQRLDAFLDRGFRSVYIHPMPDDFRPGDFHGGMITPYLSPAFFDFVAITCEQMRQRDMILWLYDEGGWPSGRAGGLLVREDPAFAVRGLKKSNGEFVEVDFGGECDYPDLMNIDATRRFIELTHERYRVAVGQEFGKTIRGFFTDEPRLLGRLGSDTIPWSPTLPEAFETQHGYALIEVLDRLFEVETVDDATQRVRRDFLRTVSNRIGECYFDLIRQWCDAHDLIFEGHHTGEHDFARHGEYFGHYLEQAQRYHVPGVDAIWRQVFPCQASGNYVSLAASSAWLGGGRVALSELFAAYGPGLTLGQMRWISAQHLVRGVNRLGIMASLESNVGSRRLGTCSDFSPDDPRWRDLDLYTRFIQRAAAFTVRGKPITPVALFYRIEQMTGDDAAMFNECHGRVADTILDRFHPLLFVGENDLHRAAEMGVEDLIVHAATPLDLSEVNTLRDAEEAGMKVQHVGDAEPPRVLESTVIQPLSSTEGVRVLPLQRDDESVELMLFNESSEQVDLRFRWLAQPLVEYSLDDDATLDLRPLRCDDGVCQVTLLPGELRAWTAAATWVDPPHWSLQYAHSLADNWTMRIAERLTITDRPILEPVNELPRRVRLGDVPVADEAFSGTLVYSYEIDADINNAYRCVLDLGEVFNACEVRVQDRPVGRRAWSPWHVDLTEALRNGDRSLSVSVTNTAASAWLNPTVHERDMRDWPNPYLKIATPFMRKSRRAGLAGPVRLLFLSPQAEH